MISVLLLAQYTDLKFLTIKEKKTLYFILYSRSFKNHQYLVWLIKLINN